MKKYIVLLSLVALSFQANAALVTANLGSFSSSATVIDFNAVPNEVSITTQYSGNGVNFSGALLGMTNPGDTAFFNGSTIASNWKYSAGSNIGTSFTAVFDSLMNKVGFWSETNSSDDVTIEAFNGVTSLGLIAYANSNGLTADFLGLMSTIGFDSIVASVVGNGNGFIALDDFMFEADAVNAVPLPAALFMLAPALLGFFGFRRKMHA